MPEWIQAYTESFIQPDKLQQIVDSFMENYDKRKEEVRTLLLFLPASPCQLVHVTSTWVCFFLSQEAEKQKEEAEQQQEDEEGWVKVTRGPKGTKARPHSEAANKKALQKEIRKKKRKELLNFYTWQHRNTQKERKLPLQFLFSICRLDYTMSGEGDREAVMINCISSLSFPRYCWTKEKVWGR